MARILYGVMGDARGHVSRSRAVAQEMPHHEFLFVGGGVVSELRHEGYRVETIPMISTIHRNNRVVFSSTIRHIAAVLLQAGPIVRRIRRIIKSYDPELILTDYEFFVPLAAKREGRRCVSLDHQHILTHCRYRPPGDQRFNRFLTCFMVRSFFSHATRYLISSFFSLEPSDRKRVEVFPPILRQAVKQHHPTEEGHVLVYGSGGTIPGLFEWAGQSPRKFIVYGMGEHPPVGNMVFKTPSIHGFLEDLASCSYVISNGGHSLISEALYYGKPVLCFPIQFLYEQFINGHFLKRYGFGEFAMDPDQGPRLMKDLEEGLDQYRTRIKAYNFLGNGPVAARLEELISQQGGGE